MEQAQGIQVGVLIIGSLYWCDSVLRDEWRREHLCLEAKQHVKAPIRYGRRSKKGWGNCFTMVFSMGLRKDQFGKAIFVPCNRLVYNFENLVEQARGLWAAESNKTLSSHISACNGWGRIALLDNPKHPIPDEFRTKWEEYVSDEAGYNKVETMDGEEKAVNESGFLRIPWPKTENGSDLKADVLLAAMTNPKNESRSYPSSKEIADAWENSGNKQHVDYFYKNRACGIETFQDLEIQAKIEELQE